MSPENPKEFHPYLQKGTALQKVSHVVDVSRDSIVKYTKTTVVEEACTSRLLSVYARHVRAASGNDDFSGSSDYYMSVFITLALSLSID